MARMHGGRRPNEKAKDFKGTMKKLIRYMAIYKVQVFFVAVFAICAIHIQYCRTEDFRKSNDGDLQWTCKQSFRWRRNEFR